MNLAGHSNLRWHSFCQCVICVLLSQKAFGIEAQRCTGVSLPVVHRHVWSDTWLFVTWFTWVFSKLGYNWTPANKSAALFVRWFIRAGFQSWGPVLAGPLDLAEGTDSGLAFRRLGMGHVGSIPATNWQQLHWLHFLTSLMWNTSGGGSEILRSIRRVSAGEAQMKLSPCAPFLSSRTLNFFGKRQFSDK